MKGRKNKRKSGAIKTVEDLRRRSPNRFLEEKIKQSENRRKFIEKLDKETAEFTRMEFAKLGLF